MAWAVLGEALPNSKKYVLKPAAGTVTGKTAELTSMTQWCGVMKHVLERGVVGHREEVHRHAVSAGVRDGDRGTL